MKKMMFAAVFSVSILLPCWLNAQEAEPGNEEESTEAPETPQKGKKGKPAKAEKGGAGETAEAAKAGENAMAKDSDIARQQKRIDKLLTLLKKAKKNSEKKRLDESLKIEQNKLRFLVKKKTDPLKAEIPRLEEQIRLCSPDARGSLKKRLAETEEKIKTLEADANLEKWCSKYESSVKNDSTPNLGSGKKTKRSKKKK